MKYTFASLGKMESTGIRIGGAGLGNILFPWAKALVYSKQYNLKQIPTTWRAIKFGTFLRKEKDKRLYYNLFKEKNNIGFIKKFFLLNFSNKVKFFNSMDNLFDDFKFEHKYVKGQLIKIINPIHLSQISNFNHKFIGVHIRRGDFLISQDESELRNGLWNYRVPTKWYLSLIKKLKQYTNLPIYIFSDTYCEDLLDIIELENCKYISTGSAISDMIALSKSKLLLTSGSTFSMWSSFLGQSHTIWFPGQMRQTLMLSKNIYEGEVDYNENIPSLILNSL